MRPNNALSQIDNFDCEIVTETLVRFTFNLVEYPQLRDANLVKHCMDEFVFAYPKVQGWAAKISGNLLILDAYGEIDPKYYGR